ncbi:MAG TPA: hypothetical protein VL084_02785 [Thermoanaerobaculia bacterium]|nr:hypothetical protein [Thermoanaerobaculia bacterium]
MLIIPSCLAVVPAMGSGQERPAPTPTPAEAPRPEPIRPDPPPPGFRRVTSEPTAVPTPLSHPKLVAALESSEGEDTERVALFDDGALVIVQTYKGRHTLRKKELTPAEVDLFRWVCADALLVPTTWGMRERALGDLMGRRIRVEVADPAGRVRLFETDDLTQLPLAVGRAKAALEDLRGRFFKADPKETRWDPKGVRKGDLLRYRSDGAWYVVVRDDSFEPSLELQETGGLRNRMLLQRDQLPKLFENPADSGAPPLPTARP